MTLYNKVINLLYFYFKSFPEALAGPGNKEEINDSQKILNVYFHKPYKDFLEKFGGGLVGAYEIYGVKRSSFMSNSLWSVVQNTKFYKEEQKWPGIEDWYIISDDGSGNPIGIDPEGKVWLSDHDAGFEHIKLADNFEEFLYKILTDTLYE